MSSAEGWNEQKLKSLKHLEGLKFAFSDYTPPSADWDHDHCAGCWAKFALFDAPGVLHSGYVTILPANDESEIELELIQEARESGNQVLAKPDSREWVCSKCFQAFRTALDWRLDSSSQS